MKIIPIALNTFRESVRDRVLYNLVIFVLLLVISSVVTGHIATVQLNLWPAVYLILLELLIITSVALLFSSFSSPALSALFTLLIFLIGRWSSDLKLIAETSSSTLTRVVFLSIYHLLPNLANFNFINETAHGQVAPVRLLISNTLYTVFYISALLAASALIFERRNFR